MLHLHLWTYGVQQLLHHLLLLLLHLLLHCLMLLLLHLLLLLLLHELLQLLLHLLYRTKNVLVCGINTNNGYVAIR